MPAPTFIGESETVWNTTTSPKTAVISVQAGDILVAIGATGDQSSSLAVSGGSLTWTLQQSVNVASFCWTGVWTATATSTTSVTVSFTRSGNTASWIGGNVLLFRASGGVGASNKTNAAGAPSLSLTTTQANSAVVVFNTDWNAIATARTWRTGAGALTEQTYVTGTQYTVYGGFHADAGAAGANTVGLSAPTGQAYGIIAVEIKGTSGTTQVSSTRRVVYDVQKNVASTRRVTYNVQASVVATRRVNYAVRAAVAATRRVTYNVLANVAATRRVAYDVAASTTQVAATRRVVYSVTAQVSTTRRVRYDVLASVLASRRVAYAVLAPVAATRRVTYDVAAGTTQVSATRRIAYSVLAQVASGRHVNYVVGDASPVTVQLIVVAHGVRQPSVPTTRHRG